MSPERSSRLVLAFVTCAVLPAGLGAAPDRLWSLNPVERREAPAVGADRWVRNPIDAFVLEQLGDNGLAPAPEADRRDPDPPPDAST